MEKERKEAAKRAVEKLEEQAILIEAKHDVIRAYAESMPMANDEEERKRSMKLVEADSIKNEVDNQYKMINFIKHKYEV